MKSKIFLILIIYLGSLAASIYAIFGTNGSLRLLLVIVATTMVFSGLFISRKFQLDKTGNTIPNSGDRSSP